MRTLPPTSADAATPPATRSFDYCFNYFQDFRDVGRLDDLTAPAHLQTSCLQLGFYLASWGMFRGKAELLTYSAKRLAPVVDTIAAARRRCGASMPTTTGRPPNGSCSTWPACCAPSCPAGSRRRW